jgi:hypothetical protein
MNNAFRMSGIERIGKFYGERQQHIQIDGTARDAML